MAEKRAKRLRREHGKEGNGCGLHCVTVSDLRVTIGDTEILQNVNLHAHCGNLLAIIGRNGAGKSTLL